MTAEEIVSRVLYRDALMLVIDKPAGLPVHPGPKGGDTLVRHLDALRFGLPRRPDAAHRLDRDTSGCLILGRHPKALARLGELFRRNAVDKTYWAVVEGGPEEDEGEIDLRLAPKSPDRGWWMKVDPNGQPALTRWRVLGRGTPPLPSPLRGGVVPPGERSLDEVALERAAAPCSEPMEPRPAPLPASGRGEPASGLTLLELRPITGRTHQLRVHCAAQGWPILGDAIYGTAPRFGGPGLHLHARAVTVPLYPKKPAITVEAPVPKLMRAQMTALAALS